MRARNDIRTLRTAGQTCTSGHTTTRHRDVQLTPARLVVANG